MHDGRTKKVETDFPDQGEDFLAHHQVTLIMVLGPSAGMEWALVGARSVAGRSPKAAIEVEDRSVSLEHAVFELTESGFRVRDLASTNGVMVNGLSVLSSGLEHGDQIQLGECVFQYVVEERPQKPTTWSLEGTA